MHSNTLPSLNKIELKAHSCSFVSTTNNPQCDCPQLIRVSSTKYLGIHIDTLLNWKSHIEILTSRTRKLIYIFKRLRCSADLDTLKTVYFALCQSLLTYCITVWGGASKTHLLQLERAQRAVLKVMTFKPFRHSTTELYRDCQILSVRKLFVLQTILRKHGSLQYDPKVIGKRRAYSVCTTPRFKTALAKRHFDVMGSHLYNKINMHCNIFALNTKLCKLKVYNWLLTKNYEDVERLTTIGCNS